MKSILTNRNILIQTQQRTLECYAEPILTVSLPRAAVSARSTFKLWQVAGVTVQVESRSINNCTSYIYSFCFRCSTGIENTAKRIFSLSPRLFVMLQK
jgi:hypothetical protein